MIAQIHVLDVPETSHIQVKKSLNPGIFSSLSMYWETPQDLFDTLNEEFAFTLDVCATEDNAKCPNYFTESDNGLRQSWQGHTCWMNPPYGREIVKWVHKAYIESLQANTTVVCLIPARTDTSWWHDHVMRASEIRLIKGRLKFINRTLPSYQENGNFRQSPAPFPSAIIVFPQTGYPVRFSQITTNGQPYCPDQELRLL